MTQKSCREFKYIFIYYCSDDYVISDIIAHYQICSTAAAVQNPKEELK